jgi:hypothetical protein
MLRLRLLKVFRPLCKVHFGAISFHARCIRSYITGQQLQLCLDKFLSSDRTAKSTSRIIPAKSQRDLQMAMKLFLVVITDFLCWMPIGVMGICNT